MVRIKAIIDGQLSLSSFSHYILSILIYLECKLLVTSQGEHQSRASSFTFQTLTSRKITMHVISSMTSSSFFHLLNASLTRLSAAPSAFFLR
jgi:hypothetical protein